MAGVTTHEGTRAQAVEDAAGHAARPDNAAASGHTDGTPEGGASGPAGYPKNLVIDLGAMDLSRVSMTREQMEPFLPHRHEMALLNHVVWYSPDFKEGVALKRVRDDEFWVRGHFPGRPLLPGVLQLEAGAQLAAFLYNLAVPEKPLTPAFTRIEHCSFRSMVQPGDDFYLLCKEVKRTRRGFTCDIQGVCNQRLTFDARIQGLII